MERNYGLSRPPFSALLLIYTNYIQYATRNSYREGNDLQAHPQVLLYSPGNNLLNRHTGVCSSCPSNISFASPACLILSCISRCFSASEVVICLLTQSQRPTPSLTKSTIFLELPKSVATLLLGNTRLR